MGDLSKNFSRREFACHCGCGRDNVSPALVAALQELRDLAEAPVAVVSGCRCPARNRAVGGANNSQHLAAKNQEGRAADVTIKGMALKEMYGLALEVPGFYGGGIGLYPGDGFMHVDIRGHEARWAKVRGAYVGIEEALCLT